MVTAAWIAGIVTVGTWVLLLRLTVRVFGRGKLDNGWDNALAYGVVSALMLFPVKWMIGSKSLILISLIPAVIWAGQLIALKVIYEVKALHALLIGATHAAVSTAILGALTVVAGFIVAYVTYNKIITDPMILVRLILRLIGLWPHGDLA